MALTVGELQAILTLKKDAFDADLRSAKAAFQEFSGTTADAKVTADTKSATQALQDVAQTTKEIGGSTADAKVTADTRSATQALQEVQSKTADLGRTRVTIPAPDTRSASSAMDRLTAKAKASREEWQKAGVPLLAAGAAITALGVSALKTGIAYNTLQQTSRAAMKTLMGSAEEANAQMDKLDDFARKSPFSKATFITAQQQLIGFGMSAKQVIPTLNAIQDSVAAFGGGNDAIEEITTSLAKVQSQGKISALTLMELGRKGIDAAGIMGEQMGKTGAQIRKDITAGSLDAGQAMQALTDGMEARFGGAAASVKETYTGALDRISAAWRDLSSELAEPLVGHKGGGILISLANNAADFMRSIQKLPGPVKTTGVVIGALTAILLLSSGAFLVMAPRILATRTAMQALATQVPKTTKVLTMMGKAAGALSIVMIALAALKGIGEVVGDKANIADVDNMTARLTGFTNGVKNTEDASYALDVAMDNLFSSNSTSGWARGLTGTSYHVGSLSDALELLKSDTGGFAGFMGNFADAVGAAEGPSKILGETFLNFDASLAAMVASGNLGDAKQAADEFTQTALGLKDANGKLVYTQQDVNELLKQYQTALINVDNDQLKAKSSGQLLAESMGFIGQMTEDQAKELQKWRDATIDADQSMMDSVGAYNAVIDKNKEVAQSTADATKDSKDSWEDYYNGVKVSVKDLLAEMQKQVDAQNNWEKNLSKMADRVNKKLPESMRATGREMVNALMEDGPDGAALVEKLSKMSKKEFKKYTKLWGEQGSEAGEAFMKDLQEHLHPEIDINADLTSAEAAQAEFLHGLLLNNNKIPVDADTSAADRALANLRAAITNTSVPNYVEVRPTGSGSKDKAYADGGVENHVAQIAQGGSWRVWAEDETGGEAYIPLAPAKRGRSTNILSEVADRFGYSLVPESTKAMAAGGVLTLSGGADRKTLEKYQSKVASTLQLTQMQQRIRDLKKSLNEKEKDGKHKGQYVMRNALDRKEANLQLKEANQELADAREANRLNSSKAGSINKQLAALDRADKAEEKTKTAREKEQKKAEDRAKAAQEAAKAAEEKQGRLSSARNEVATSSRRGEYVSSVTSGRSGALSTVDQMYSLSQNEDLTPKQRANLSKAAGTAETALTKLYDQLDVVTAKLTDAQAKADAAQAVVDSVQNSARSDFVSSLTAKSATPASFLAALNKKIADYKQFGPNLKALAAKGLPKTFLTELVNAGLDGAAAASKLLNAPNLQDIINSAAGLDEATAEFGDIASELLTGSAASVAQGIVAGLKGEQDNINGAVKEIAEGIDRTFRKEMGIASPSKRMIKLLGYVGDGAVVGAQQATPRVSAAVANMLSLPTSLPVPTVQPSSSWSSGTTSSQAATMASSPRVNLTVINPIGEPTVLTVEKALQDVLVGMV